MNQTESWYYNEILKPKLDSGEYVKILYERFRVILVHSNAERKVRESTYTPDFWVLRSDGQIEVHEVKGWADEADNLKFKVASQMYDEFRWFMIHITKKKIVKVIEY